MENLSVFLLPGLVTDARLWKSQISALAGLAHCSVGDLTGSDTIPDLATKALAQAPAGRFVLVGLSLGGYVALEIMRQAPERVLALALLDTSARADTPEATEGRRKAIALAETDFPAVIKALVPKLLHPSQLQDVAVVGLVTAMAMEAGKDVFQSQQKAILGRVNSRPFLPEIQCPTLVLCGREDAITPIEMHEEMVSGIPISRLEIIEKCGHLSPLGQPHQVSIALRRWLLEGLSGLPAHDGLIMS